MNKKILLLLFLLFFTVGLTANACRLHLKYKILKSNIHGMGVFSTEKIKKNEVIDLVMTRNNNITNITPYFGSMINHCSKKDNTKLVSKLKNKDDNMYEGSYYLVTKEDIEPNTELTINYNNTPYFIKKPESHYLKC